jgi:DNA repair exonuclease SbcCD nuclease subunit
MIPGNHDMADMGKYHALKPFGAIANVYSVPTTVRFDLKYTVAMIPFMYGRKEISEAIQNTPGDILIAHEGILGVTLGNHTIENKAGAKSGISLEEVLSGGHQKVYLGHFHDPECLKHPQVKFIGSPLHKDAGDYTDRGFLVVDLETLEDTFIKTIYPEFISLNDDLVDQLTDEQIRVLCEQNYVRVTTEKPSSRLEALKNEVPMVVKQQKSFTYENRIETGALDNDDQLLVNYVKFKSTDEEQVNRLLALGASIIERTAL